MKIPSCGSRRAPGLRAGRRALTPIVFWGLLVTAPCLSSPVRAQPEAQLFQHKLSLHPPAHETLQETSGLRELYFQGMPYGGKPTQVFAYLGVPGGEPPAGGWPGVVLLHGGGGTAYAEWVKRWNAEGFAAIAMDLEGQRPAQGNPASRSPVPHPGPRQAGAFGDSHLLLEQQFPFHAVATAVRAHSLLAAQPNVNPRQVGLCGVSWGSIWATLAAGIDGRNAFVIPIYGHGFLQQSRSGVRISPERAAHAARWDPALFVPSIQAPALFIAAASDHSFEPGLWQKTVNLRPEQNQQLLLPGLAHSHEAAWAVPEAYPFARQVVAGGKETRLLQGAAPGQAQGTVLANRELAAASYCYTTDSGPYGFRKWHEVPATPAARQLQVPAGVPASKITGAYFLARFGDGSRRSSPVVLNVAAEVAVSAAQAPERERAVVHLEENFEGRALGPWSGAEHWSTRGQGAEIVDVAGRGRALALTKPITEVATRLLEPTAAEQVFLQFSLGTTPGNGPGNTATQKLLIYAEDAGGKALSMMWRDGTGQWGVRSNGAYNQKPLPGAAEPWTRVEWILDQKARNVTLRLSSREGQVVHYATVPYANPEAGPLARLRFSRNQEGHPGPCYLDDVLILSARQTP